MKKLFILIIVFITFNCGSIYYTIRDGELPNDKISEEMNSENINWVVTSCDIVSGFIVSGIHPAGIIFSSIFITFDYLTGAIFKNQAKE